MGFPKPLLRMNGETFMGRSAASMLATVERLIIVLGAHREAVTAAVPADDRISIVENPDYTLGQLSSIKAGLGAVSAHADAAIVHLVDHPTVLPETFRRLAHEYQSSGKPILVVRCRGGRGHPVLFDRSIFDELQQAPTDVGARAVYAAPALLFVFPVIARIEPATASPQVLFGALFIALAVIAYPLTDSLRKRARHG